MNANILKKCLDELKKSSPKIDYVIGMLETLYEMQDDKPVEIRPVTPKQATVMSDGEGQALNAQVEAKLAEIKRMAAESM